MSSNEVVFSCLSLYSSYHKTSILARLTVHDKEPQLCTGAFDGKIDLKRWPKHKYTFGGYDEDAVSTSLEHRLAVFRRQQWRKRDRTVLHFNDVLTTDVSYGSLVDGPYTVRNRLLTSRTIAVGDVLVLFIDLAVRFFVFKSRRILIRPSHRTGTIDPSTKRCIAAMYLASLHQLARIRHAPSCRQMLRCASSWC